MSENQPELKTGMKARILDSDCGLGGVVGRVKKKGRIANKPYDEYLVMTGDGRSGGWYAADQLEAVDDATQIDQTPKDAMPALIAENKRLRELLANPAPQPEPQGDGLDLAEYEGHTKNLTYHNGFIVTDRNEIHGGACNVNERNVAEMLSYEVSEEATDATGRLFADAPALLAEVKQLRERIAEQDTELEELRQQVEEKQDELNTLAMDRDAHADELATLREEIRKWKPMTLEEADKEMAAIEAGGVEPLSDDDVARMMAKIKDPTYRPTEPEHVRLLHQNATLRQQVEEAVTAIKGAYYGGGASMKIGTMNAFEAILAKHAKHAKQEEVGNG